MSKVLYTGLFFISFFFCEAQSIARLREYADDLYEKDKFLEATEFYEKIVEIERKNSEAKFMLGLCYYNTLKYEKSKDIFLDVSGHEGIGDSLKALSLYYYGFLLKHDYHFKEADSIFSYIISLPNLGPDLIDACRAQKQGCSLALSNEKEKIFFTVDEMKGINSEYHDYGAVINVNNSNVVFSSARLERRSQHRGTQYKGALSDIIIFKETSDSTWTNTTGKDPLSSLNTDYSEGSGVFTSDGKKFYFSSCRQVNKDKENTQKGGKKNSSINCLIMVSYYDTEKKKWSKPIPLNENINMSGYESKHPSISKSSDTLFFSSDRIGSYGKDDIWMSIKGEGENWIPAINMGELINTSEDEITPFYSSVFSALFFSSNGHIGYGGYDIFVAKGKSFFQPEIYNLTRPLNSNLDDLYFSISKDQVFMSSNRMEKNNLNLFNIKISDEYTFLRKLLFGMQAVKNHPASIFPEDNLNLLMIRNKDIEFYKKLTPQPDKKDTVIEKSDEDKKNSLLIKKLRIKHDVGGDEFELLSLEDIYFDFGSSLLNSRSIATINDILKKIANIKHYTLIIDGFSGSKKELEDDPLIPRERGYAIKNYMVDKGVPSKIIKVYPKEKLSFKGSEEDREFEKALNRRAELSIQTLEKEENRFLEHDYFVLKETMSIHNLSTRLNIPEKKLQSWNMLSSPEKIQKGTIIKIHKDYRSVIDEHILYTDNK